MPPEKVEVPVPWEIMWPPVRTKPFAEASPPALKPDEIPPAKVEVAVEEAFRFPKSVVNPVTCKVDEAARLPPTLSEETAVDDAWERKPEPKVARPLRVVAPAARGIPAA
jgi:hypothetical protein